MITPRNDDNLLKLHTILMTTRYMIVLCALLFIACQPEPVSYQDDLSKMVNPFIGTGAHGHTYPGPSAPFGMVQLGPDTRLEGWDGASIYHYTDSVIYGFSHTHLSGTGITDYGDILVTPTTGEIRFNNGADGNPGYGSYFDKSTEKAHAGYYEVLLDDYQVKAQLTTSKRTGFHLYTFPENTEGNIILDLDHRDKVVDAGATIVSDTEVEGYRISTGWAREQHVYFVMKFSKPFSQSGLALNNVETDQQSLSGENVKGYFTFDNTDNEQLAVQVGISAVSIEGARKNLEAEMNADWDFEATKSAAEQAWNEALKKVTISTPDKDKATTFYTALYHSMLNPNLFNDVDGAYRGMDGKIGQAEGDHYTIFSLWDTFRAAHPLYTLLEQERTNDFIRTFLRQYKDGGELPIWELAGNYTGTMIGYHAIPVIADAIVKGIDDYDLEEAYEAMKHSAMLDKRGLKEYKEYGYIPATEDAQSVSQTLEYAYDDWCIAQIAKLLGKEDDYNYFIRRSQYYKNIFDPSTGFMRGKKNNTWFTPFDPAEVNFNYTEANSWQYSFFVPQDVTGLYTALGGKEALGQKLDELFTVSTQTTGRHQADITGLIGQYAHGNEPSHHMAYLYNYINQPWKTQFRVHQILTEQYWNGPEGLSGNEDCGQMSAWYVLSAMGFYPVTPGSDEYIIGSPLMNEATMTLENGKQFTVRASNVSDRNIYIQSATLNGEPYSTTFIRQRDIMNGGILEFEMGSRPNESWGSDNAEIPVSNIEEELLPVPFFEQGESAFFDNTTVALAHTEDIAIHYTTDGSTPNTNSTVYDAPFEVNETTTVRAMAVKGDLQSNVISSQFFAIPEDRKITLNTQYAPQYSAGGDNALIDYVKGGQSYLTGSWQGYEGIDIDAVVDFGKDKDFSRINVRFLQDEYSWVWMPLQVEYYASDDGTNFTKIGTVLNKVDERATGVIIRDFELNGKFQARYLKVLAKNRGVCPPWHKGDGGKSWIFADEIVVE